MDFGQLDGESSSTELQAQVGVSHEFMSVGDVFFIG